MWDANLTKLSLKIYLCREPNLLMREAIWSEFEFFPQLVRLINTYAPHGLLVLAKRCAAT